MSELKESVEEEAREVTRGRRWYTPFFVVGTVAAVAWTIAGLVTAVAILIWLFA